MNTYKVQHKVHTLSQISIHKISDYRVPPEFTIEWFRIIPFEYIPAQQHLSEKAWIVEKEVKWNNAFEALDLFYVEFNKISPKIAFLSQCYFEYLSQSFVILKMNDNPEKKFVCRDVSSINGIPLHFQDQEIIDFNIIMNTEELKDNQVFIYLQDYYNSTVWRSKAMLLFAALEALAGRVEKTDPDWNNYFTYDKARMKRILWNELYNIVFWPNWLRHKLNHWDDISGHFQQMQELWTDYWTEIYLKIIHYFNHYYWLKISEEVVNPWRHFFGNLQYLLLFMKPKIDIEVNLFKCKWIKDNPDFIIINRESNY
jgi:hypothetical protein